MFHVENLTVRDGDRLVLDRLSLTAHPGRITALVDPGAAGGTALIRCASRQVTPESGGLAVLGEDLAEHDSLDHVIGSTLETEALPPSRTVRAAARGVADRLGLASATAEAVLTRVGLTAIAKNRVRACSPNEWRRLAFALAVLGDRPVLLLDEPTRGQDPVALRMIGSVLRERAEAGATVVITARDLHALGAFADHVVLLGDGEVLVDEPMAVLHSSGRHRDWLYPRVSRGA